MHDPMTVLFEIRRPWPQSARSFKGQEDQGRILGRWLPTPQGSWTPPDNINHPSLYQWGRFAWIRHQMGSKFWVWFGRVWYFPSLITVWHIDRDECGDDDSCTRGIRWAQSAVYKAMKEQQEHYQVRYDNTGRYPRQVRQLERIHAVLWWLYRKWRWTHPHHWKVQFRPWQNFMKMFDRCEECGERFKYGYAPVSDSWGRNPKRGGYFSGRTGLRHLDCWRVRDTGSMTSETVLTT